MNGFAAAALLLAIVLVALKLFVVFLEPRLTFYPFAGVQETPRDLGVAFRDLTIETSDGERLSAWWIEPPDARTDVVYSHGNGGNLSNWLPVLVEIARHGCAVLAFDYRGYGASSGSPSERGVYLDANAALALFERDLHRPGRAVVYWGRSLGTAVAAYAVQRRAPDGLILESPFPDKAALIAGNPLFRFLNLFGAYRFPTLTFLRGYASPSLVIHGDADTTIDPALGRRVFEALNEPKQFLLIRGADHNDLHVVDPGTYWHGIDGFLRSVPARSAGIIAESNVRTPRSSP